MAPSTVIQTTPMPERHHSDPKGLWVAAIVSSLVVNSLGFWMLGMLLWERLQDLQTTTDFIPVDLIVLDPEDTSPIKETQNAVKKPSQNEVQPTQQPTPSASPNQQQNKPTPQPESQASPGESTPREQQPSQSSVTETPVARDPVPPPPPPPPQESIRPLPRPIPPLPPIPPPPPPRQSIPPVPPPPPRQSIPPVPPPLSFPGEPVPAEPQPLPPPPFSSEPPAPPEPFEYPLPPQAPPVNQVPPVFPGIPDSGSGQPQPESGQPQPESGQPQPGTGQPQPGSGQPQPGSGQPQPGSGQPQPGGTYQVTFTDLRISGLPPGVDSVSKLPQSTPREKRINLRSVSNAGQSLSLGITVRIDRTGKATVISAVLGQDSGNVDVMQLAKEIIDQWQFSPGYDGQSQPFDQTYEVNFQITP
ncbi:hypothetical protein [Lyngbya aestuarii]|uniref:hypothetical protein n=1 Tax=Lyngbya aestuarii TaxID=118322 RepID=UPI00403D6FFB